LARRAAGRPCTPGATLRGWTEVLQNPAESASLPLHYDPALDPAHELEVLRATAPLVHTGVDGR
jgi:hypothetical protein